MPKDIIIFKNLDEARKQLFKFYEKFEYPKKTRKSQYEIVKESVGSNILRAFHKIDKPSEVYREWANMNFNKIIDKLYSIKTISEYDKLIYRLNNSLLNHWYYDKRTCNNKLIYGPSIKMINLLFKTILEEHKYFKKIFIPFLHVPFDKYSLTPLINIINQLTEINFNINIPTHATMKYVNTKELYEILLKAIRKLSNISKIDPIVFDYWCWNDKH